MAPKLFLFPIFLIIFSTACSQGFSSPTSHSSAWDGTDQPPDDEVSTPEGPIVEPPAALEKARWEDVRGETSKQWTRHAYNELEVHGLDMLGKVPGDAEDFCPNYVRLNRHQKKTFWVYLLSAVSQFESNFNPDTSYTEAFADSTGQMVVSRGLLQLSLESARGYGCELRGGQDLHDPLKNLSCGIRILNRWVGSDGVIRANNGGWKGGARYWSVLRREAQYGSIRGWTSSLKFCVK